MSWKEKTVVEQRKDMVEEILAGEKSIAEISRKYGVSRQTAYKWLERHQLGETMEDQSRKPIGMPQKTDECMERLVLKAREVHPSWGPRKLKRYLENQGYAVVPAASTVQAILKRNGKVDGQESAKHRPYKRFERERPNELWQADFIGDYQLGDLSRCYPLTVIDDCTRYALAYDAKRRQGEAEVRETFERLFCEYGRPESLLTDNAAFWAGYGGGICGFEVWLMKHGILPIHGRVYHPQTQGKIERLNRTMGRECLQRESQKNHADAQDCFDHVRRIYNEERPHEALGMGVPASRYQSSSRVYDRNCKEPEYETGRYVRKVASKGYLSMEGHRCYISEALQGRYVEIVLAAENHERVVCYGDFVVAKVDLRKDHAITRRISRRPFHGEGVPPPHET